MHITAQGLRLRNDLYCVKWDVRLYYTYILNIKVSQGSVATRVRCDGNLSDQFFTQSLLNPRVKFFWKISQYLPKLWAIKYRVVFLKKMKHRVYIWTVALASHARCFYLSCCSSDDSPTAEADEVPLIMSEQTGFDTDENEYLMRSRSSRRLCNKSVMYYLCDAWIEACSRSVCYFLFSF